PSSLTVRPRKYFISQHIETLKITSDDFTVEFHEAKRIVCLFDLGAGSVSNKCGRDHGNGYCCYKAPFFHYIARPLVFRHSHGSIKVPCQMPDLRFLASD